MIAGLSFALMAFIFCQVLSFTVGTRSVFRRKERDIRELSRLIKQFSEGLIPFSLEEFKILSAQVLTKQKNRAAGIVRTGLLSSIYQEALFAFASIEKDHNNEFMLIVHSLDDVYRFETKANETTVWFNDKKLGKIDDSDTMLDPESNTVVSLSADNYRDYYTVYFQNKEIAHLNMYKDQSVNESDRIFSFFHEFKASEDQAFIAYVLYFMLARNHVRVLAV